MSDLSKLSQQALDQKDGVPLKESNSNFRDESASENGYSQPSTVNSTPVFRYAGATMDSPVLMPLDGVSSSNTRKRSTRRRESSSSLSLENVSIFDILDPITTEITKNRTYQKVKNYSSESIRKLNQTKNSLKFNLNSEDMKNLKEVLSNRVDRLYVRLDKAVTASTTEKLYYSMSVYFIFFCGLVIGKHPEWFHVLYSVIFTILMPVRILTYYKVGFGYYLADLCYFVNGLLMLFIWVFPDSKMLFVTCSSFSFGTLSFAVLTWKNKLVLHSIEKTTSTFIHVLPPVVMYVIQHQLPSKFKQKRFHGSVKLQSWEMWYGIVYTSLIYFIWQSLYHYFITIKRAEKIKNGRVTSYEHLRKAFAKKAIGKFVNSLPEPFGVVAFTLIQYGYQLGTMLLCPFVFKYKYFASVFVSFIFFMASYHGATYYVDFYGKRLQKEVVRLQSEIDALQSKRDQESNSLPPSPVVLPTTVSKEPSVSKMNDNDDTPIPQ